MVITLLRNFLVVLSAACIGGNIMATPEIEKKLYNDLAAAWVQGSTTKADVAISKAYKDAADAIVIVPPGATGPTGPTGTVSTNPTGTVSPTGTAPATGWPLPGTVWPYGPKGTPTQIGYVVVKEPNKKIDNFIGDGIYQNGVEGLIATNGKLDGKGSTENGIQFSDFTATGVEVTATKDGFKAHGDVLIENCWVHDLTVTATSHNDGVQISGGTNVTIKNTRFEATAGKPEQKGTAAIFAKPEGGGSIGTVTIEGNYFNRWGNFFIQTSKSSTGAIAIEHLIVRNNVFGDVVTYVDWADTHRIDGVKKITWENNRDKNGNIVSL